jgi:hexosaminidase
MAMVKLNVFHWHITDSQTFPMVTKSHPDLSRIGAYAKNSVYQPKDIYEMVQYAKARGVLVIPEFDAPAHVSEGWQETGLVTCHNFQPWNKYCPGPPCGQLDPSQDRVYDVLEDIYRDMFDMFDSPPFFHMGGDEVNFNCWNSSEALQERMLEQGMLLTEDDFLDLWFQFQTKAHDRVVRIWSNDPRIILWTSTLTESDKFVVDKEKYIIQIGTTGTDPTVKDLLNKGYDLIMSNHDALYFDCGFGLYVDEGNNWCSPYKAWTQVYNNNLRKLVGGEQYEKQILGAEACFWSSISDEMVLDSRLWPRLSALAERLWVEPEENFRSAESRMLLHR